MKRFKKDLVKREQSECAGTVWDQSKTGSCIIKPINYLAVEITFRKVCYISALTLEWQCDYVAPIFIKIEYEPSELYEFYKVGLQMVVFSGGSTNGCGVCCK